MRAWCSAAVLMAVVVAEVGVTGSTSSGPPPDAGLPAPQMAQAAAPELTHDYGDAALARPLFSVSRRPPAGLAGQPGAVDTAPPPRLSGVVIVGSQRRAIFQDGDKSLVATVGSSLGKYRIISVDLAQVTLEGPNGAEILKPSYDGTASVATTPPSILAKLNGGLLAAVAVPPAPTVDQIMARLPMVSHK